MRYSQYTFHEDAGHGWLEVPFTDLAFAGVHMDISHYSYMQGTTAYLEEDDDAGKFMRALAERGYKPEIVRKYQEDSFIRKLNSYDYSIARPLMVRELVVNAVMK